MTQERSADPSGQNKSAAQAQGKAKLADNNADSGRAASPLRWLLVIVPLLVIAAAGSLSPRTVGQPLLGRPRTRSASDGLNVPLPVKRVAANAARGKDWGHQHLHRPRRARKASMSPP